MYVTDYTLSDNQKELKQHNELKEDEHPALTKFALLSRRYDWGEIGSGQPSSLIFSAKTA